MPSSPLPDGRPAYITAEDFAREKPSALGSAVGFVGRSAESMIPMLFPHRQMVEAAKRNALVQLLLGGQRSR